MPSIKLLRGTFSRNENGTHKTYREGDTVHEVSEKLILGALADRAQRCPVPVVDEVPPVDDVAALREYAIALGVEVKPQWNADKLKKEIDAHGDA